MEEKLINSKSIWRYWDLGKYIRAAYFRMGTFDGDGQSIKAAKDLKIGLRSVSYYLTMVVRWPEKELFEYALEYIDKWCLDKPIYIGKQSGLRKICRFLDSGDRISEYITINGVERLVL